MTKSKTPYFSRPIRFATHFSIVMAFLVIAAIPTASMALDMKSYFSVTRFNLEKDPARKDGEKKKGSPLNADLIYRVAFGRADDVKILLSQGADPDARNPDRLPALIIAIIRKDDEAPKIVKNLLDAGGNINIIGPDGTVPVAEAVKRGRADVLQSLIDHKAVLGIIRDAGGFDILNMAEKRGDLEIVNIVNAGLEREKDQIESLKSPENFVRLVQDYAFLNCANEYLSYYISTNPGNIDMVEFNRVMNDNGDEIEATARKIRFLFKMGAAELGDIRNRARGEILYRLKTYQTNENRKMNGVGTDADLNGRCTKISDKWNAKKMNMQQYNFNTAK